MSSFQDKRITDFFDDEVFFLQLLALLARCSFENWHSALEMKLYIKRYIHHIGGLPDFKALRFTRHNQYESIILPMTHYPQEPRRPVLLQHQGRGCEFDINGERAGEQHRGGERRPAERSST